MSTPDYIEMGRELAENRDATLVNAANRGVKYHEELEAANQRLQIERVAWRDLFEKLNTVRYAVNELESSYRTATSSEQETDWKSRAEAAERKLATVREILSESDPHVAQMEVLGRLTVAIGRIQRAFDAIAEIEQPQEPKA